MNSARPSPHRIDREDVLLWLFMGIPVLAWIAAQQLSFLAAQWMCQGGHRWTLYVITGSAAAVAAAAGAASWMKFQTRARTSANRLEPYRRFMALGGVALAGIVVLSILALMIPATLHRLCD